MFAASLHGRVNVAQWLAEIGAIEDATSKDSCGATPLHAACENGHLTMAKWLFEVGAAEQVCEKRGDNGSTPLHAACSGGHLHVAQWLFHYAGASADAAVPATTLGTPLAAACASEHIGVAQWLILEGAANDPSGHVNQLIIYRDTSTSVRKLHDALERCLSEHSNFSCTVLPAAHRRGRSMEVSILCGKAPEEEAEKKKNRCSKQVPQCCFLLFEGHEETLLSLVADFLGLLRGRKLRIAREATDSFRDLILSQEAVDAFLRQ